MQVALSTLEELTKKAILSYGYTPEEAALIQEVLLYAQLRGNNQGVVKLTGAGIPKSTSSKAVRIEKETKLSALINGGQNHAMIVVNQGTNLAIQKAREHGIAVIGVNNLNTSSGALGYYAKKIADAGLVGLIFAGSMETVATHGSYEPLFGTNPFAFAAPTENDPLVFDMTTAAMAFFGVVEANIAGRALPEGIAYDKAGNLTTSPEDVLNDGALRTFDQNHKGAGISMMVQILTGPLVGAYFTGIGDMASNWGGHLIIAIDPEVLGGLEEARRGVTQMIEKVKNAKRLPGVEELFVPGERGDRMTKEARISGQVEIDEKLYEELKKVSKS